MTTLYIDPIHGHIKYPDIVFECVNTEEFQRLRNVKQLGASSWVYSGGTHTRFEHCLGVCHLVDCLLSYLETNSNISISKFHRNCIMIAGLLHDIGHGPFSHMWEHFVHLKGNKNWNHEDTSCDMTRELFNNNSIKLSNNIHEHNIGIELICAFISGNMEILRTHLAPEQMYLSEIVNNKFCSIDVDKWDYILRDAYYLNNVISIAKGFPNAFKGARITKDCDGVTHISYHYRHYPLIFEIFQNRTNLHRHCYRNAIIISIEQLLVDTLELAENVGFLFKGVKLSEAHRHPKIYKYLDDTIINQIATSDDPALEPAQTLIKRLKQGQLYTIVHRQYNEFEMNAIDCKINKNLFMKCHKIGDATETMPKTIILHDDNGQIVNSESADTNWFDRFVLYSRNALAPGAIDVLNDQPCSTSENGY